MHKALCVDNHALILVIRGTGKTTAIALTREVLLSSYTYSAVDTILVKLEHEFGVQEGTGPSFGVLLLRNADKVSCRTRLRQSLCASSRKPL